MAGDASAPVVVRVQQDDFDLVAETARLTRNGAYAGAVVTFTGLCRDEGGKLSALELEHYPGMAEAEIGRICRLAVERFSLLGITAIQMFAIAFLLAGPAGDKVLPYTTEIGITLLWVAALITMYTGYDYFRVGLKHIVDE